MKKIKTFWCIDENDCGKPSQVDVMVVDGKHELFRYVHDEGSCSSWCDINGSDYIFCENKEEAEKIIKKNRAKMLDAICTIYDNCDDTDLLEPSTDREKVALKWYDRLGDNEGYVPTWTLEQYIRNTADFMRGKPMCSDAVAFTINQIVRVKRCKDGDEYFYKVVLSDKSEVIIYNEEQKVIIKNVMNVNDTFAYVCNGELDKFKDK